MRKFNVVLTIVLTVIAVAYWILECVIGAVTGTVVPFGLSDATMVFTFCACVGWVLLTITSFRQDEYTRCRKCRHILRGITEPRCPECGEPI